MAIHTWGVTAEGVRWLILPDGSIVCAVCRRELDPHDPARYVAVGIVNESGRADYAVCREPCGVDIAANAAAAGLRLEFLE